MSDLYEGMCIGGPADGEIRESPGKILTVIERNFLPGNYSDIVSARTAAISTVTQRYYQFVPFRVGDHHRGLWAFENATPLEVFDALLAGYKNDDGRRLLEEATIAIDNDDLSDESKTTLHDRAILHGVTIALERLRAFIRRKYP